MKTRAPYRSSVLALAGAAVAAVLLSGCASGPSVAETVPDQLPDLAAQGYTAFECDQSAVFGADFVEPSAPYVAQCWTGAPDDPFVWVANDLLDEVVLATEGVDVSQQACAKDVLNETTGIACRAVYVGEEGNDVLVRIIVTLADAAAVLGQVPEEDVTADDVIAALTGAELEVLIGTEPIPEASATPGA